jgi:hypothetical protein
MMSFPKIVGTGLDFFSPEDFLGHNFSAICFYQTGYNLFEMRQAAGRAWRIKQWKDCQVYYLYYRGTMQQRAMQLMAKKMAAATALEGNFSSEGLIALAGDDNEQMALARSLSERISESEIRDAWNKSKRHKGRPVGLGRPLLRLVDGPTLIEDGHVQLVATRPPDDDFDFIGGIDLPDGIMTPQEIAALFAQFEAAGVSVDAVF